MFYIKKIKFGGVAALGGIPSINTFMYVPVSDYNSTEIRTHWNNMSSDYSGTLYTMLPYMAQVGILGGGFPFLFPSRYTGSGTYDSNQYYDTIKNAFPYSAKFAPYALATTYLAYCDSTGHGIYTYHNGIIFYDGGTNNVVSAGYWHQLGYAYSGSGATPTMTSGGTAMFVCADGIVGFLRYAVNKNNSSLTFASSSNSQKIVTWLNSLPDANLDPYGQDGETETQPLDGTFDGSSDPIDIPTVPALSAYNTNLITIFNPSMAQLNALGNYLWSSGFDVDAFKKIFADPMDCILGLSIVPVAVPIGGTKELKVGNIGTGVSMSYAGTQFVTVDCGSISILKYWGSYLDYEPYTKAEIYLPYIGMRPISVDDIMGEIVSVVYHVDILSGACVAYVKVGSSVLYSYIGQCSCGIPVTSTQFSNILNGVLGIAGAVGTLVATGGASAPLSVSGVASSAVNALKPDIERSGSMSGTGGMLGIQKPYLVVTRPRQAVPLNQNTFMGYPSFVNMKLSDLHGYTEVESIHLENVPAMEEELNEIERLLKSGVIM